MAQKEKRGAKKRASYLYVGGVRLDAGWYLASNADAPVKRKPDKNYGYAHYDGETLTLCNYVYCGGGVEANGLAVAIDASNATTDICFKGENSIEVIGREYAAALLVNDGQVTISGKGTLCLSAQQAARGCYGMLGSGAVRINSGTVKLQADVPHTAVYNGQPEYMGDSYAMHVGKLTAKMARVRGSDNEDGPLMNRNSDEQVIIDFPRVFLWWLRRYLLPLLLLLIALAALGIAAWALLKPEDTAVIAPDFNLLQMEQNAESMPDDGTQRAPSAEGGGSVVLNFSYDVQVDLSEKKTELYFGLPQQSNKDAVLQVVVDDVLLCQSGRLPPGYQVRELPLQPAAAQRMEPGIYAGEIRVLYYNEQTGERAILDTKIEVNITVNE